MALEEQLQSAMRERAEQAEAMAHLLSTDSRQEDLQVCMARAQRGRPGSAHCAPPGLQAALVRAESGRCAAQALLQLSKAEAEEQQKQRLVLESEVRCRRCHLLGLRSAYASPSFMRASWKKPSVKRNRGSCKQASVKSS